MARLLRRNAFSQDGDLAALAKQRHDEGQHAEERAAGALFGVLALVGTLLRQRREIGLLRRRLPPDPTEAERAPPPAI